MLTPPSVIESIDSGIEIIKEIVVEPHTTLQNLQELMAQVTPCVNAFQLNFDKNNIAYASLQSASQGISQNDLRTLCTHFPVILSIPFDTNQLSHIIEHISPLAINLKGGEEEKVGLKSYDQLDEVFDFLEEAYS